MNKSILKNRNVFLAIFCLLAFWLLYKTEFGKSSLDTIIKNVKIMGNDSLYQDPSVDQYFIKPCQTLEEIYWSNRNRTAQQYPSNPALDFIDDQYLWRPTEKVTLESYDDRILAQFIWSENIRPAATKHIAIIDGSPQWWYAHGSPEEAIKMKCPNLENHCDFIKTSVAPTDAQLSSFDAVLFDFYDSTNFQKFPAGNYTRVFDVMEGPWPSYTSATFRGTDILMTHWRGADIVASFGKWVYYDPKIQSKVQEKNYAVGKTKMAAIFLSKCGDGRFDLVKEMQSLGLSIDIYGQCGTLQCTMWSDKCYQMLKKDYKFYLAFENSKCRDYITEKFFTTALMNDVVPVVNGPPLEDYIHAGPLNSFIHYDSFPTAKALVDYLQYLDKNDDEYNKYFRWKGTGEQINIYPVFCRLCGMLHYSDVVPIPLRTIDWHAENNTNIPKGSINPCVPYNKAGQ